MAPLGNLVLNSHVLDKIIDAWSNPKNLESNQKTLKVNGFDLGAFVEGCMKIYNTADRTPDLKDIG